MGLDLSGVFGQQQEGDWAFHFCVEFIVFCFFNQVFQIGSFFNL